MVMFRMLKKFGIARNRLAAAMLLLLLAASTALLAAAETAEKPAANQNLEQKQDRSKDDRYYDPLPQETGAAGLKLMLRRLQTTARLMQVTAHPDDEDGGMLTLEARGKGVSTLLMTLTRGEGGQNKLGSNLFDALGVLRTLELLASDRYYGVEQRFSRVADFGFSKTAEETFQKWQGHDIALADMVRVIRTFRPDVLVARFSGTERDGHGHHQASAILTKEAFRAAADPKRFPEQIAEGLAPWQPKKLYIGNVCGFMATTCDPANYTLRLNTGIVDPVLGASYIQFAMQGLRHQQSQGAANWTVEPGDRFTYYKLVDSVVDSPKDKDGHEQSFFDGIDETLPGLASRLGEDEKKVPWLREELESVQRKIEEADAAAQNPSQAVEPLIACKEKLRKIQERIYAAQLSHNGKDSLESALGSLVSEFDRAIVLAAGIRLEAVADAPGSAIPGQKFDVTAKLSFDHGWEEDKTSPVELNLPQGWESRRLSTQKTADGEIVRFRIMVPDVAQYTRPYWHRANPGVEAINTIDDSHFLMFSLSYRDASGPMDKYAVAWLNRGQTQTELFARMMARQNDSAGEYVDRPVAIVPPFSVALEPPTSVIPASRTSVTQVKVGVHSNVVTQGTGILRLQLPDSWVSEPKSIPVSFSRVNEDKEFVFRVRPPELREGRTQIKATLGYESREYMEGYSLVTREDLGAAYYYQPATQRISVVDVKVPGDLKVGYVMGAGDEIPTVLQQIGMDVTLIPPDKLSSEDLSHYQTIVLGIRAYDTQKNVIANNQRMLDFVQAGGRLVVQYNASAGDFNTGKFTPYPATLSRARVSVEEAPVTILDPANPIFHSPNEITQKDFDGWVQERGLYFMSQWDANFTPLLESHDPGEGEQKGGLLIAHYGKGTYIYTGYAFFRQLPAGVPGAVRLFVNLIGSR
jgi:LmbE family N-acetylglucosaminyl deacetylase